MDSISICFALFAGRLDFAGVFAGEKRLSNEADSHNTHCTAWQAQYAKQLRHVSAVVFRSFDLQARELSRKPVLQATARRES